MRRGAARWLVALGLAHAVGAAASEGTWHVQTQDHRAGQMQVRRDAGGAWLASYSYRDNGRGPDMEERFEVDAQQRVRSYRVTGKATFGAVIDEEAHIQSGRVAWRSTADQGDEALAEGGVFVPLDSTPAYWGQVARSLLAAPGGRAPAPGGAELAAERLLSLEVQGPGGPRRTVLVAVTGITTEPVYVWLDDDETRGLFGVVAAGWSVLPPGWESAAPTLLERQREAQTQRLRAVRERARQPLPGSTLIRSVRWFDAPAARLRGPSDVWLFDGRIAAITAPGAFSADPDQVIEGQGRTLLPGLWDLHAHLSPGNALMHLAGGVTGARDLANENSDLLLLKQRIESGEMAGPAIVPAGFIEGQGAFAARNGFVVDSLDEGLRAVDWYAARGYRQIKLYNSIRPEWVRPLARRAHRLGLKVGGHVPAFMRAEDAVRAGYDELTHINQLMLNFLVRPGHDTRTLLRFTLVGDEARRVAADDARTKRFIALLRQRGTVVDPTLATFEAMFRQRDGEPNPSLDAIASHLPVLWRRSLRASEMSPTAEQAQRYRASWQRMLDFVGALHRAGVPLVAGTDAAAGLMLHRELELYVQAGIPAAEALRIATWNGPRVAGAADRSGRIAPGRPAELLLVQGDPTRDIATVRRGVLVVQGAQAYAPAELYRALGIRPFVDGAEIVRRRRD